MISNHGWTQTADEKAKLIPRPTLYPVSEPHQGRKLVLVLAPLYQYHSTALFSRIYLISIVRLFLQAQLAARTLKPSISSNVLPGRGSETLLNEFMGFMDSHPS